MTPEQRIAQLKEESDLWPSDAALIAMIREAEEAARRGEREISDKLQKVLESTKGAFAIEAFFEEQRGEADGLGTRKLAEINAVLDEVAAIRGRQG